MTAPASVGGDGEDRAGGGTSAGADGDSGLPSRADRRHLGQQGGVAEQPGQAAQVLALWKAVGVEDGGVGKEDQKRPGQVLVARQAHHDDRQASADCLADPPVQSTVVARGGGE